MKIVLNQNDVGRFNFLGNEESLAFSVKIIDGDEGKIVERDGVKCVVRLSTDDDPTQRSEELGDLFDRSDFDEITRQCLEAGQARYVPEIKAFIAVYVENFAELRDNYESSKKSVLEKKIVELQHELKSVRMAPAHYEMAELIKGMADKKRKSAEQYRNWQQDYKESSDQYQKYERDAMQCDLEAESLESEYEQLYKICESYDPNTN